MVEERLDLRDLVAVIVRHRKIIGSVFVIAVVLALIVNLMPPVYEATVNMRVRYARGPGESIGTMSTEELMRQQIFTYAEIVKSRSVVEQVLDTVYGNKAGKPSYNEFVLQIEAVPVKNTEILTISVRASTPEEAQKMANALVSTFHQRLTEIVRAEGREARTFIGERLVEVKRELDKVEKTVVEYKKNNRTVAMSEQLRHFLERQSSLQQLAAENQLTLEIARSKMNNVNQQIGRKTPGFIVDSPLIQIHKAKLADQEVELAGLLKTLTPDHPRVKTLQTGIEETKGKIRAETQRQAVMEISLAQTQRAALERLNKDADNELSLLPAKEQGLARLMRDYSLTEEIYTLLAKRYEEARINEVVQPTNVQIVDMAALPDRPVKPRRLLNLAVAMVLGLFVGVSAAFLMEYFNKTIDTAEDVQRHLGMRVIGSIPSDNRIYKKGKKRFERV